jgi:RHS repeat-associated protein
VRPHAVSSVTTTGQVAGVSEFTWDAAGSMTGRKVPDGTGGRATQSLTWDPEGELASVGQDGNADGDVVDAGEAVAGGEYVYTADGERLVRAQGSGTARKTTVYLPGGQEVTASASAQISAVRYYSFAGQTIAMRTGSQTEEIISISPDHHGTGSVQITNLTSTVTRRYTDPFGAERGTAGPTSPGAGPVSGWVGDHGFLDKPTDATGLTAVGARMFDPGLGAFASVDPVMDLADPQQWNAYAYSNNNPTTWSDPTGLKFDDCDNCVYYGGEWGVGGGESDPRPGAGGGSRDNSNPDPPVLDLPGAAIGDCSWVTPGCLAGQSWDWTDPPGPDWDAIVARNDAVEAAQARTHSVSTMPGWQDISTQLSLDFCPPGMFLCATGAIYYDFVESEWYWSIGAGPATPSPLGGISLGTAYGVSPGRTEEVTVTAAYYGGATASLSSPLEGDITSPTGGSLGVTGGMGMGASYQWVLTDDFQGTESRRAARDLAWRLEEMF